MYALWGMVIVRTTAYGACVPDLFDVVADPTRRELLRALLDDLTDPGSTGESSVGQLVAKLGLSQPTVSKHLKTLRELHVVIVREQGQHRYYRLDPAALDPVAQWLAPFAQHTVAAAESATAPVAALAALATVHPLHPRARGVAVRLGAGAAAVALRLRH